LDLIQKVEKRPFLLGLKTRGADGKTLQFVRETLKQSLSIYTRNVSNHLKTLPIEKRIDSTLATTEEKYHLYMLEIELVNRIYREEFKRSEYKFALIAHCLRDFRPGCRSEEGEFEAVCRVAPRTASFTWGVSSSRNMASNLYFCRNGPGEAL
jgi:hypothetical protein